MHHSVLGAFAVFYQEQLFARHVSLFVHQSACMEQLGSHWRDLHEMWYLRIFQKSV
jgi:hypothetical protein